MTVRRQPRRNNSRDLSGRLATQSGPRTTAPIWPRPFFTPGEWAVYTALWSYPNESVFPTHQDLADRAWVERGTAADAVAKMDELGLLERQGNTRDDGSDTSNTYYLIEVPTAEHLRQLEQRKAERAAEQEAKRRKRKAANRKYGKAQVKASSGTPDGGYGEESTPAHGTTSDAFPSRGSTRGYGADRTPGGTVQAVPRGYGVDRTHESLGVSLTGKGTVRTTSSSNQTDVVEPISNAELAAPDEQEKNGSSSKNLENQEDDQADETKESVLDPRVMPTLTEWETALLEECLPLAGSRWSRSGVRKVLGSRRIREVTARDPELVRRAFLIGARNRRGVTLPIRMWYTAECPHWREAEKQLAAGRAEPATAGQPETPAAAVPMAEEPRRSAPRQAKPVSVTPPTDDYQSARAAIAERLAARQSEADQAEAERRRRHAERLAEAGVLS